MLRLVSAGPFCTDQYPTADVLSGSDLERVIQGTRREQQITRKATWHHQVLFVMRAADVLCK